MQNDKWLKGARRTGVRRSDGLLAQVMVGTPYTLKFALPIVAL